MKRLEGRTALITGAARGLGAQIARRFVDEGANVIINDLSIAAAQATADELGGQALACDVSDSVAVQAMFERVAELTDGLDILVNNAGISGIEGDNAAPDRIRRSVERAQAAARGDPVEPEPLDGGILDVTDEQWLKMIAVHMNGTFFCSREAVRLMGAAAARPASASIINMSSIMGTFGRGGGTAYCTAKAGILGFTRALAHELAGHDIRVNAIAPGWIHTDMTDPLELMHPLLEAQTPMGRMGEPDDIAWAAVYLASAEANFVTGQTLSPNGGWYMSQ
ncbi:MAG: SDR family NAD(P)-dependent oxidoreductase [Pseudomonadales bacterium]|jgi:3-oxoacyl-[acyl-carrier protein] reductase